jgi:alpha-tubulin suppressor-like RCC1 family protein
MRPFSITRTTCTEFTMMAPGATCTADVTFAPTELGPYRDQFSASFQGTFSGALYAAAVVSGGGGDPIYFGNAGIGPHPVGATITTPVAVTNVHRVPVTLGTVSAAALQIAAPYTLKSTTCVTGAVLEPDASCTLTIAFSPTTIGSAARNIRLAYTWNEAGTQSRTTTGALNGSGAALRRIEQVAVGKTHKCALFEDGGVRCWGQSELGALGHGSYPYLHIGDDEQPAAAGDVDLGGSAVQISAGEDITCALLTTGAVRCWGRSAILGYARELPHYPLRPADLGDIDVGGPVKQIATGAEQTCALLTNGKVRCWGTMGLRGFIYTPPLGYPGGQDIIGDDETPASAGDIDVGGEVAQITAGDAHVCALLTNGKVRCWGDGQYGQLGYGNANAIGDDEHPASAGDVNVGGDVVRLSGGSEHTCALLASGAVRCWGHGVAGILGYGNTNTIGDNETPASAGDVNIGGAARDVSAGARATCALLNSGTARCWGSGTEGTLGYANTNTIGDDETPASAGDVNVGGSVAQIVTEGVPLGFHPWGENGMCALLTTGTVRCWGMRYLGYPGVIEPVGDNELPFTVGDVAVQ